MPASRSFHGLESVIGAPDRGRLTVQEGAPGRVVCLRNHHQRSVLSVHFNFSALRGESAGNDSRGCRSGGDRRPGAEGQINYITRTVIWSGQETKRRRIVGEDWLLSSRDERQVIGPIRPVEEFARRGDMRDVQKIDQVWRFGLLRGIEHRANLIRLAQVKGEKSVHFRNVVEKVAVAKKTKPIKD